jgi:hypothetical protein
MPPYEDITPYDHDSPLLLASVSAHQDYFAGRPREDDVHAPDDVDDSVMRSGERWDGMS